MIGATKNNPANADTPTAVFLTGAPRAVSRRDPVWLSPGGQGTNADEQDDRDQRMTVMLLTPRPGSAILCTMAE
jgi:hypothetical protein